MRVVFVSRQFMRETIDMGACDPDDRFLIVDVDRCIGCGTCELACRIEHGDDIHEPTPFRPVPLGTQSRPDGTGWVFLPQACRHCETPCEYHSEYNFWIKCPTTRAAPPTVAMCDSCTARLAEGMWPACATRCSMKTIYFGGPDEMRFLLDEKRLREMGDVEYIG